MSAWFSRHWRDSRLVQNAINQLLWQSMKGLERTIILILMHTILPTTDTFGVIVVDKNLNSIYAKVKMKIKKNFKGRCRPIFISFSVISTEILRVIQTKVSNFFLLFWAKSYQSKLFSFCLLFPLNLPLFLSVYLSFKILFHFLFFFASYNSFFPPISLFPSSPFWAAAPEGTGGDEVL